jgi:HEAT repeat protein
MSDISELPFQTLIDALLDEDTPFDPRYLYRLSDLEGHDLNLIIQTWPQLPLWRRQALMEDLHELGETDDLLSFENIGRYMVSDEDPQVRLLAAQILWEFEERDLVQIYLQLLKSDPIAEVRAASASGLGQFVYLGEIERLPGETMHDIEDQLLEAVNLDPDVLVQCRALESVGFSSRSEVPNLVEKAFASEDPKMKISALIAMGRTMDSRWEATILKMMNNTLPGIRAEAARAAGEIEMKNAVPTLIELTTDSEQDVRSAAIWSLSQIGGERARYSLQKLFQEADDDQEADLLEGALDNLAFTDGMQPFSLFDFPEDDSEDELLEMLISQEGSSESDGNGSDRSRLSEQDTEHLDDIEGNHEDRGIQD